MLRMLAAFSVPPSSDLGLPKNLMRPTAFTLLLVLSFGCASAPASRYIASASLSSVPPRGSLVIVGGGPRGDAITDKFIALAGGAGRARILVLPMASSCRKPARRVWRSGGSMARRRGARI